MKEKLRKVSRNFLALFFIFSGAAHFVSTRYYLLIMPPYVPWPLLAVYASGVLEMALGASFLMPRFRRGAGWGLIALLLAIFPANIHMAMNPEAYPALGAAALWLRLPLQFLLMAWIRWSARIHRPAQEA